MFSRRAVLSTTVVAGLVLSQSSCTLIGAGIGELVDATTARSLAPQELAPETIEPSQKITVRLRDGRSIEGRYIAILPLPADEYAERYESARERHSTIAPLPQLGDTVTLHMARGGELNAEFLGFDLDAVSVRTPGAAPERVRAREVRELRAGSGGAITGAALEFLLSEGALPVHSALALQTTPARDGAGGKRLLPLDRIALIEWDSDSGRTVGTIVGGVVDAALIVVLVSVCAQSGCGSFGS